MVKYLLINNIMKNAAACFPAFTAGNAVRQRLIPNKKHFCPYPFFFQGTLHFTQSCMCAALLSGTAIYKQNFHFQQPPPCNLIFFML